MMKGETVLTGGKHPDTNLIVMESSGGFFLGFRDIEGTPYTRETGYMTERMARAVLELIRR
jgi:hypothetical protein